VSALLESVCQPDRPRRKGTSRVRDRPPGLASSLHPLSWKFPERSSVKRTWTFVTRHAQRASWTSRQGLTAFAVASAGFPLIGGHVDSIVGRSVAAPVCQRREHMTRRTSAHKPGWGGVPASLVLSGDYQGRCIPPIEDCQSIEAAGPRAQTRQHEQRTLGGHRDWQF